MPDPVQSSNAALAEGYDSKIAFAPHSPQRIAIGQEPAKAQRVELVVAPSQLRLVEQIAASTPLYKALAQLVVSYLLSDERIRQACAQALEELNFRFSGILPEIGMLKRVSESEQPYHALAWLRLNLQQMRVSLEEYRNDASKAHVADCLTRPLALAEMVDASALSQRSAPTEQAVRAAASGLALELRRVTKGIGSKSADGEKYAIDPIGSSLLARLNVIARNEHPLDHLHLLLLERNYWLTPQAGGAYGMELALRRMMTANDLQMPEGRVERGADDLSQLHDMLAALVGFAHAGAPSCELPQLKAGMRLELHIPVSSAERRHVQVTLEEWNPEMQQWTVSVHFAAEPLKPADSKDGPRFDPDEHGSRVLGVHGLRPVGYEQQQAKRARLNPKEDRMNSYAVSRQDLVEMIRLWTPDR